MLNVEGVTALTLDLMPAARGFTLHRPRLVVPETHGVPDVDPGSVTCTDSIQLDVVVSAKTADGALDEQWDATVVQRDDPSENPDGPAVHNPSLEVQLDLSRLAGTLEVVELPPDVTMDDRARFACTFPAEGPTGALFSAAETRDPDAPLVGRGTVTLARW